MDNTLQDLIDRYIYQVCRYLPASTRKDVGTEIRTLIADMLDTRTEGLPQRKDVEIVLLELGEPVAFAARYHEPRYLIGPDVYHKYMMVLRIVLGAVLLGMSVVTILQSLSEPIMQWYMVGARWLDNVFSGLFAGIAWVTVIFAVMEWTQRTGRIKMGKALADEVFSPGNFVGKLPPVPVNQSRIPLHEPIVSMVFTTLVILLFVAFPQWAGVYVKDGTGAFHNIPLFALDTLRRILPLLVGCMALDYVKQIVRIQQKRYTWPLAWVTLGVDVVAAVLTIVIFLQPIWNPDFAAQVIAAFPVMADIDTALYTLDWVQVVFPVFLVMTYALDVGTAMYRAWRYGAKEENKA